MSFGFSRNLTLLAGQVQVVQADGEGGLQTPVECKRVLQVLRLLHEKELVVQPT